MNETRANGFPEGSSRLGGGIVVALGITVIYTTLLYGGTDTGVIALWALSTSAVLILWAAHAWKNEEYRLYFTKLYFPIAALLIIGLIQLLPLRSVDQITEILGTQASSALSLDPYNTRLFTIRLLFYSIFFAAAMTFVNTEKRARRVVWWIIIFGSLLAFFGILQWLTKPDAIYGLRPTPQAIPFGPFVNQHHFAALMEMTGGLTLGVLLGNGIKKDKKPLLLIALVLMAIATILTASRGGVLSFAAASVFALIATFVFKAKKRSGRNTKVPAWLLPAVGISAAVLLLMILVVALGGEQSLLRGTGIRNAQPDFTSGRSGFWKVALQIFLSHPILGAGFDAFGAAYSKFDPANGLFRVEQAHNDYLQMLADGGIAAFACIVGFIYLLFKKGLEKIRYGIGSLDRSIAIGALSGCFGILVHSGLDFPLRTPANGLFFLMLVTLATVKTRQEENGEILSSDPSEH